MWLRQYLESPATTPVLQGQSFVVAEGAAPGDIVGEVEALGAAANQWLILGGSGREVFEIDGDSGLIRVAAGAVLDAAATPELTLDVVARDECTPTRVSISVQPPYDAPPVVPEGQVIALDEDLVAGSAVTAVDAEGDALHFAVVGGTGVGIVSVDAGTGAVALVALVALPSFDRASYTLEVVASDAVQSGAPSLVTVTLPNRVRLCIAGHTALVRRPSVSLALHLGATLGACE